MVIMKRLTATLAAGATSLTFTDAVMNSNSIIEIYAVDMDVYPTNQQQTGEHSVTVTFDAQIDPVNVVCLINNIMSLSQPEEASNVTYDNTVSGMSAIDVQGAIDELQSESDYHEYSTDEKIIGKWIDDRPIYEKVMVLQSPLQCPTNVWTYVPNSGLGTGVSPLIVDARVIDGNGTLFAYIGCNYSGGLFGILNIRTNNNINISRLILQYTKSTD